ncbi:hypothetical protein [Limnofasciculus baicalensis]|uniref:Uncharacterized protein n=1 Tax=Limnofasciculus baicalensis BBK-W-15 TaxID=2699891 RepID=A0AAE3GTS8_9CYAN|nr:hypothetical protein [Limnofasciculus baicalensis]MCP2729897.1 hypothetical protein [Limnofasciculus baicalensis BBK-W-15]
MASRRGGEQKIGTNSFHAPPLPRSANTPSDPNRLQWGLASGGLVALILCGVGSWWLTQQSLLPIEQNFQKLDELLADIINSFIPQSQGKQITIKATAVPAVMLYN